MTRAILRSISVGLIAIAAIWGYVGDYLSQLALWLPVLGGGIVLLLVGIALLRRKAVPEQ